MIFFVITLFVFSMFLFRQIVHRYTILVSPYVWYRPWFFPTVGGVKVCPFGPLIFPATCSYSVVKNRIRVKLGSTSIHLDNAQKPVHLRGLDSIRTFLKEKGIFLHEISTCILRSIWPHCFVYHQYIICRWPNYFLQHCNIFFPIFIAGRKNFWQWNISAFIIHTDSSK